MRVLAAENISKRYGERALLSDVTLQINQGDKIGLIGVNGTGKSTLLRLLAGEEVPDGGSVFCQPGQRVAYLPQNPAFAPEDTVLGHVLRYAGRDVQRESYRAKAILTKLGVTDFGEKTGHLSGGQRKRLAMAAALVQAMQQAGVGSAVIEMDGKRVGQTIEPDVSQATWQRTGKSVKGRASRMVLA